MRRIVAAYPNDHLGVNSIILDPMWRSRLAPTAIWLQHCPFCWLLPGCAVADLRQRGHADAGAVCFASPRAGHPAVPGCNRVQLVRQMLLEGVILSLCAGAVALLLTSWSAETFAWFHSASSNPIVLNGTVDNKW